MNETDFNKIIDSINSLTVYREIKNNKIIDILRHILTEEDNLPYMAELVATLTEMQRKAHLRVTFTRAILFILC